MMEIAESDPKSLILVIADMARSNPPMEGSFVAELARRLQGHGPALALPLTWIEQRLAESSRTIEQLVRSETQQQAADQVSISNTIGSLRHLGAMDWRVFVESMSLVEQVLREDIDGVYGRMDFATRDRYRHVIARLAKRSPLPEAEVARAAIALARQSAATHGDRDHRAHVGFYLIDQGLPAARTRDCISPLILDPGATGDREVHAVLLSRCHPVHDGRLLGHPVTLATDAGIGGWRFAALGFLVVLGASQFASALANWLSALLTTPQPLPKMDFSQGLPPERAHSS